MSKITISEEIYDDSGNAINTVNQDVVPKPLDIIKFNYSSKVMSQRQVMINDQSKALVRKEDKKRVRGTYSHLTSINPSDIVVSFRLYTGEPQTLYYAADSFQLIKDEECYKQSISLILLDEKIDDGFNGLRRLINKVWHSEIVKLSEVINWNIGGFLLSLDNIACAHSEPMSTILECRVCPVRQFMIKFSERYGRGLGSKNDGKKQRKEKRRVKKEDIGNQVTVLGNSIGNEKNDLQDEVCRVIRALDQSVNLLTNIQKIVEIGSNALAKVKIISNDSSSIAFADTQVLRNLLTVSIQTKNSAFYTLVEKNETENALVAKQGFNETRISLDEHVLDRMIWSQLKGIIQIWVNVYDGKNKRGDKIIYPVPYINGIIPKADKTRTFELNQAYLCYLSRNAVKNGGYFPTLSSRILNKEGETVNGTISYSAIAELLNGALKKDIFRDSKNHESLFIYMSDMTEVQLANLVGVDLIAVAMDEIVRQMRTKVSETTTIKLCWIYKNKLKATVFNACERVIEAIDYTKLSVLSGEYIVDWAKAMEEDEIEKHFDSLANKMESVM